MEIPKKLIECLNRSRVQYEVLHHPLAYTAQNIAEVEHVKGRSQAKVVMIKSGTQHLMAVCPADHKVDVEKMANITGKPSALEKEEEFKPLFPDCATGAMPPFGSLYGLPTYVDRSLTKNEYIVFEAGTHTDAIKLNYCDYERIVQPMVEDITL